MLLFFCAAASDLPTLHRDGAARALLYPSLDEAERACEEVIVVVESARLGIGWNERAGASPFEADVPAAAPCNLDPYLPPAPVTAGGGYVMRAGAAEPEVLLIFRRGVWDLPKGKLDEGETVEACALREVGEEIGVEALRLVQALGTTQHGYAEKGRYRVKTTFWYLMHTSATAFEPEEREGIEAVAWTPWSAAVERIGYDTLRRHMQQIGPAVHAVFGDTG